MSDKRDHSPILFEKTMGLYARNDMPIPPPGYAIECTNCAFDSPNPTVVFGAAQNVTAMVRNREVFESVFNLGANIVRWWLYTKSTGSRIIYLTTTGDVKDFTAGAVIYSDVNAVDFHGITINDRFYFTTIGSDGLGRPSAAGGVKVYDPSLSATARNAAGRGPLNPPDGVFTVAVSATAGNIEPGLHVISVSYEYNTGYISPPKMWQTFTAPAARKRVDLTNVPVGPTGVVARWVWLSHRVNGYDGNPEKVETFFAYKINDNVTTVVTGLVDGFDSQLLQSSDPYADGLDVIPQGTFLSLTGDGRLVVCGSQANSDTLYISNSFEPESVDSVDGLKRIAKGIGGGVYTTRILRKVLYCFKGYKTYSLNDNGDVPSKWIDDLVDDAMGSSTFGVAEVMNSISGSVDYLIVGNTAGLFLFTGSYIANLVYNIEPLWKGRLDITRFFKNFMVIVDPIGRRIYANLPKTAGFQEPNYFLFMLDYNLGLSPDKVRISQWSFLDNAQNAIDVNTLHCGVGSTTGQTVILVSYDNNMNIHRLSTGSWGVICNDAVGPFLTFYTIRIQNPYLRNLHCDYYTMVIAGGNVNNGVSINSQFIQLPSASGVISAHDDFSAMLMDITLQNARNVAGNFWSLAKLIVYIRETEMEPLL